MTKVRLEIDEVTIYRPKKRWQLYFVIMTEHPEDKNKMIIGTFPQQPIKLSERHNNSFMFDTNDEGSEGLFIMSRELPAERELNVHIYLRHTREGIRSLGSILKNIETGLGSEALGLVENIVGNTSAPWLVITKKAIPLVGKILEKIPDRDFGFLSAFERFGPEFETQTDIDRKKEFSGDASLIYSWSVDK